MMNANKDNVERALEICIQNKIAAIFEKAVINKYPLLDFINVFLSSKLYTYIYDDYTIYSQAPGYALEILEEEIDTQHLKLQHSALEDMPTAHWMGYLFAEWYFLENITGVDILKTYNIQKIYNNSDILHTQSIKYAIDFIKENYRKTL